MPTPFTLALPRLHAGLCPLPESCLPEGCLTLWPGLPSPPKRSWRPRYPWDSGQAAACLEDFRRASRDGFSGTPVLTLGAEPAPPGLSRAERDALREMLGAPAEDASLPPRLRAQKTLLLTWLQEEQALELTALEQRVRERRRSLTALLSGEAREEAPVPLPAGHPLPDWTVPLAAALTFLPDMPAPTAFFVNSSAMAAALAALGTAEESPLPGCEARGLSARSLARLCGRNALKALEDTLTPETLERPLTLILPRP